MLKQYAMNKMVGILSTTKCTNNKKLTWRVKASRGIGTKVVTR